MKVTDIKLFRFPSIGTSIKLSVMDFLAVLVVNKAQKVVFGNNFYFISNSF